ncbi:MAG: hypothetical protein EAY75_09585, partial [Bacteroidetes bacterium]
PRIQQGTRQCRKARSILYPRVSTWNPAREYSKAPASAVGTTDIVPMGFNLWNYPWVETHATARCWLNAG